MTGDARRWALWSVEGVSTQATPGWIPRFTGKKILPREITRQEKSAGEGGSGEGRARGGLQRENTGLQSSLPRELLTESPPVARWSCAAVRGCRSKYASPQIWLAAAALVPLLHSRAALALRDGVGPAVSASGGAVEGDGEQLEAGTSAERSQRRGDAPSVVLGEPPRRPYPRRGRPPPAGKQCCVWILRVCKRA
jgi:hypothetical protein